MTLISIFSNVCHLIMTSSSCVLAHSEEEIVELFGLPVTPVKKGTEGISNIACYCLSFDDAHDDDDDDDWRSLLSASNKHDLVTPGEVP